MKINKAECLKAECLPDRLENEQNVMYSLAMKLLRFIIEELEYCSFTREQAQEHYCEIHHKSPRKGEVSFPYTRKYWLLLLRVGFIGFDDGSRTFYVTDLGFVKTSISPADPWCVSGAVMPERSFTQDRFRISDLKPAICYKNYI